MQFQDAGAELLLMEEHLLFLRLRLLSPLDLVYLGFGARAVH